MKFDDYQEGTARTAIYPGQGSLTGLLYVSLGLGEAGEIQNKVKKVLRDDDGVLTDEKRQKISEEIGGLLWYASQLATELGYNLGDIAAENLAILSSRHERGVIKGEGDER